MNRTFIILSAIFVIAAGVFVASAILFWLTKFFKIENASYKKSLLIVAATTVIGWGINALLALVNENLGGGIVSFITSFVVFYYVFRKLYPISWKKIAGLYITLSVITFVLALVTIGFIRFTIAEPFFVRGQAMNPTFNDGDYLIINKLVTTFARGDVVIFRDPETQKEFLIRRVVGLPGERVEIKEGQVFVNNQPLHEPYTQGKTDGQISATLGHAQYFVLSDNRSEIHDSRQFGAITADSIRGKILLTMKILSIIF